MTPTPELRRAALIAKAAIDRIKARLAHFKAANPKDTLYTDFLLRKEMNPAIANAVMIHFTTVHNMQAVVSPQFLPHITLDWGSEN